MKQRTIGLEYEFCAIYLENGRAINRDTIKSIWRDWSKQPHVELYFDKGTQQPVGINYTMEDGRSFVINTDGGVCLVEFSSLPFATLLECKQNLEKLVHEFLQVAAPYGVGLLSHAVQPKTPWAYPDLKTEKTWYRSFGIMPYFQMWHSQFHTIAAHQVCIGISYDEIVDNINTMCALGGVTIALFANSSVFEHEIGEYHEEREYRWERMVKGYGDTVKRIQGIPEKPFTSFRDYLEYNWSILLPAGFRGKDLFNFKNPKTIVEYLRGGEQSAWNLTTSEPLSVVPDITDVNMFNMYLWIQARPKLYFKDSVTLKQVLEAYDTNDIDTLAKDNIANLYVENRNIAAQPWEDIMTAPAYCLGLLENIQKAKELVATKEWSYWVELRQKTTKSSMEVPEVIPFVEQVLEIAKEGLQKRGLGEEEYLEPLFKRLEKRESPAMKAIKDYNESGLESFIKSRTISLQ